MLSLVLNMGNGVVKQGGVWDQITQGMGMGTEEMCGELKKGKTREAEMHRATVWQLW